MRIPAIAGSLWLALAAMLAAQSNSSLSDQNIEFTEAKVTLQSVSNENARLREQLMLTQQQVKALTQSLAVSNSEAEVFRRESSEMKLRMEALGIEAAGSNKARLEQRILQAVSDLKIVQDEKDKLTDQLMRLSEAVIQYLKTASNTSPEARMALEVEMRGVNVLLGLPSDLLNGAKQSVGSLSNATVVGVKEEIGLVVANIGRQNGVKPGMPFKIMRMKKQIGLVRAVDVREKISGLVIQDIDSAQNKIKVGDHLEVEVHQ